MPGGILLLFVIIFDFLGWLTLPMPALDFLFYCGVIGGILLAWRFHSSRVFFCLMVLFLAVEAISVFAGRQHSLGAAGIVVLRAVAVLVPADFALISLMQERGFTLGSVAPVAIFFFIESVVVIVLGENAEQFVSTSHARHISGSMALPEYAAFVIAGTAILLIVRFLFTRKPVDGALFWSLLAFAQFLRYAGSAQFSTPYSATAVGILAISIIENSYLLAYHDELTALPSRRAFNDALLRLQDPFSIAVVDIDHFKKFNDTYGHDTGDQVLRLVASKLGQVTGGGKAYRCGGEEFTILFPNKATNEVLDHIERLRLLIESSEFYSRGTDRRSVPRGPDRRREGSASRPRRKADAIRELSKRTSPRSLSVTVSIGVAGSAGDEHDPNVIVQSADKALYRAKANGRNRVETALPRRRSKSKTAGIA
ncbi:MAG TPA: GGDEF domain-containing protein [Candidatus Sulfotelmatobacter sp.]|nr:GGDEF domain-containing protein [Candidatus Sulfotelmatobacter sp.]